MTGLGFADDLLRCGLELRQPRRLILSDTLVHAESCSLGTTRVDLPAPEPVYQEYDHQQ